MEAANRYIDLRFRSPNEVPGLLVDGHEFPYTGPLGLEPSGPDQTATVRFQHFPEIWRRDQPDKVRVIDVEFKDITGVNGSFMLLNLFVDLQDGTNGVWNRLMRVTGSDVMYNPQINTSGSLDAAFLTEAVSTGSLRLTYICYGDSGRFDVMVNGVLTEDAGHLPNYITVMETNPVARVAMAVERKAPATYRIDRMRMWTGTEAEYEFSILPALLGAAEEYVIAPDIDDNQVVNDSDEDWAEPEELPEVPDVKDDAVVFVSASASPSSVERSASLTPLWIALGVVGFILVVGVVVYRLKRKQT